MTTAESSPNFQTSFHMENCDTPEKLTMSENLTDTEIEKCPPEPIKNSSDMEESEKLCGTNLTENSTSNNKEVYSEISNTLSDTDLNTDDASIQTKEDEWLDIMGSGNFKKKIIKSGLGHETRPNHGDRVVVDIMYYVNNSLIEEKENFSFIVGDLDVIQGIDLAICLMEKEEKAKVQIPSKLAYGTVGLLPHVPPDSDIECDIELKEVESLHEETLTVTERLKLGDEKRCRGNFFYEREQFIDAVHCYERSAEYLDGVRDGSDSSPEELQEIVDMRLKIYNNMAAAHLKLSAYSAALRSVESVLKVQPKNVKALFRKGKILGLQGSTDEAISCMKSAANLEPNTKIIQVHLTNLRNQKKKEEQTQKLMYQRMFKSEPEESHKPYSHLKKWSMIGCGILAIAVGSAVAYRQYHL